MFNQDFKDMLSALSEARADFVLVGAYALAVQEARGHKDLYFAGLLSQHDIDSAMGDATALARRWIYKPIVTLTVFLTQCLSPDHSCREAVSKLLAWRTKQGLTSCSVVFSLAVGTAVEMTIGKYKGKLTGENSMFRELYKFFQAKDVMIADRAYAGWFDIALCVHKSLTAQNGWTNGSSTMQDTTSGS